MSIPDYNELYLGLAKIIRDKDPTIPVVLRGMPLPNFKTVEQWLAFDLLGETEKASRNFDGDRMYNVQLTCYSVHGEFRNDKSIDAPYKLAYKYKPLLHRANHIIKSSCFRTLDTRIAYLDLRASGDYSKQIFQSSPSLTIHSCVIYTTGHIS